MPAALPSPPLGDRFERASAHAIAAHRSHRRASSDVPFVAHLFATCALVLEHDGGEPEAVAALLHDVVDDTDAVVGIARLREDFGDDIARIVEAARGVDATFAAGARAFYDSKRAVLDRIEIGSSRDDSVALVVAASGLAEARATRVDLARGEDAFARMHGKKFGTLWGYRALADALRDRGGVVLAFATELEALVDEMAGKPVTTAELLAAFSIDDSVIERDRGTLTSSGSGS